MKILDGLFRRMKYLTTPVKFLTDEIPDEIPDYPSGDIDEASDKETGGWRLSGRIVAHLEVMF